MAEILRPLSPRLEDLCGMAEARLWGQALSGPQGLHRRSDSLVAGAARSAAARPARHRQDHLRQGAGRDLQSAPRRDVVFRMAAPQRGPSRRRAEGDERRLQARQEACAMRPLHRRDRSCRFARGRRQQPALVHGCHHGAERAARRHHRRRRRGDCCHRNYPDRVDPRTSARAGRLDTRIAIPIWRTRRSWKASSRFHLGDDLPDANLGGLAHALATTARPRTDVEKDRPTPSAGQRHPTPTGKLIDGARRFVRHRDRPGSLRRWILTTSSA